MHDQEASQIRPSQFGVITICWSVSEKMKPQGNHKAQDGSDKSKIHTPQIKAEAGYVGCQQGQT